MGHVIGINADQVVQYKRAHQEIWPEVLAGLSICNLRNYSIFLNERENLMFSYWEYHGNDFGADMKKMLELPRMQEWWDLCAPMQEPLATKEPDEWWSRMEEVFHLD